MARLRRSDCRRPGIRRRRAGRGFYYLDPSDERVTDPEVLARVRALAIPPAWTDVWISPWPNGHIQALGTDDRGRRQYRYHEAWTLRRDREKFQRMVQFASSLPRLRRMVRDDLSGSGFSRRRVLACAARLLDLGFFRVGGEGYAEENGSYGLATMLREHISVEGETVTFDYPAKSGRHRVHSLVDPVVADLVEGLRTRRGGTDELLAYEEAGTWVDVRSDDVNAYLKEVMGAEVSAKDFRTWNATLFAAVSLAVAEHAPTVAARKRAVSLAMVEVSHYLGNTPAVCRRSYVDPRVVDLYMEGATIADALPDLGAGSGDLLLVQGPAEERLLELLSSR